MIRVSLIFNLFIMLNSILENYPDETFMIADGFNEALFSKLKSSYEN